MKPEFYVAQKDQPAIPVSSSAEDARLWLAKHPSEGLGVVKSQYF